MLAETSKANREKGPSKFMAEIAPFRQIAYNQEKIRDLAQVVIPPYVLISPDEQNDFHRRSPYNFIRLELGLASPEDSNEDNPHTRAAALIGQWERGGIFVRNPKPSVYCYELDYKTGTDLVRTRKGFICAMRLEEFSSGKVRPHEKTFQAVKDERLSLMLACNANLSPVFALYPIRKGGSTTLLPWANTVPRQFHSPILPVLIQGMAHKRAVDPDRSPRPFA